MKTTIHWAVACAVFISACSDQPFTVDVPFRITSVTPSPGGQNIARRAEIVVTFSEDIDPDSVTNDASFKVEIVDGNEAAPVAGNYAYGQKGAAPYAASFKPKQPMPWGATVRLTLTTDVKRARDKAPLPTPISFEFQLETAPGLAVTAVTAVPADSPDAKIAVTFSEPVKCASLKNILITETYDSSLRAVRGSNRSVSGEWECDDRNPTDAFNCQAGECTYEFTAAHASGSTRAFDWSSRVTVTFNDADAPGTVESVRGVALSQLPSGDIFTVRMPDPPAFSVVGSSPASGAVGVAQGTTLQFTFTAPPLCVGGTLPGATVLAADATVSTTGASSVPGNWTCASEPTTEGNWTATFTPNSEFSRGATITTELAGGRWSPGLKIVASTAATSVSGSLKESVSVSFTIVEPGQLAVESTSPVKNEFAVAVNAPIKVVFTEDIKCETVKVCANETDTACSIKITELLDGGASQMVSADASCESRTALIQPLGLSSSSLVSVELTDYLKSTNEGSLVPYTFSYRLVDPPPFRFVGADPGSGAKGVEPKPTLTFAFSHPPVCESNKLTGATVTAGSNNENVAGTWDCSENCESSTGCAVTFKPTAAFPLGTKVKTVLQAGLVQTEGATSKGGKLPETVTVFFHVVDPQPLLLASSVPAKGATGVSRGDSSITLQFSRDIECADFDSAGAGLASLTLTEKKAGATTGNAVSWSKTSCGGSQLVIKPTSTFALSSDISLALAANGVRATDGGRLENAATVSWTVEHPEPLIQVSASAPSGYDPATPLSVQFSRTLDCDNSFNGTTKTAEKAKRKTNGTLNSFTTLDGNWSCEGSTVTFKPTGALGPSEQIRLSIGSSTFASSLKTADATTVSGYLKQAAVNEFRVRDPEPLKVVSTKATTSGETTTVAFEFDRKVECPAPQLTISDGIAGISDCDDNIVTLASSQFINGKRYTATANKITRALDATTVGTTSYGTLGEDVKFEFEASAPLKILATSPEKDASRVSNSAARLDLFFNQEIDETKFRPCASQAAADCNIEVKKKNFPVFIGLSVQPSTANPNMVSFSLASMEPNTLYQVTIKPSATGPVSKDGKARLTAPYTFDFTSAARADVADYYPEHNTSNVSINTDICITFTDDVKPNISTGQFVITPSVQFAPVPLTVSGANGLASNKVCLNLVNQTSGLPLNYEEPYQVSIQDSIEFETLAKLESNKTIKFTTEPAPDVEITATYANSVVTDPQELAAPVPFNAKLSVRFVPSINRNTVNTATVKITKNAGETDVPVSMHVTDDTVTLTSPTGELLLEPSTQYRLEIMGGMRGVLLQGDKAMGSTKTFTFTTSDATTFDDDDPDGELPENEPIVFSATRALHAPSITSESAFGQCHGVVYEASFVTDSDGKKLRFTPTTTPVVPPGAPYPCAFSIESNVLDELGNPVEEATFTRTPVSD